MADLEESISFLYLELIGPKQLQMTMGFTRETILVGLQ